MNRRISWIDALLMEWASWMRDHARWQGWGGGIDRIEASDGKMPKAPGSYSDRVLSELIACEANRHGRPSRVHVHILALPQFERRVVMLRYAGRPIEIERKAPKVGPYHHAPERQEGPRDLTWSGPMAFVQVAEFTGRAVSTECDALDRAKLRLMFRMEVDRLIRGGTFVPDAGKTREQYAEFYEKREAEKRRKEFDLALTKFAKGAVRAA